MFAAYHTYAGPKQMEVYDWDDHEGGRAHFDGRALPFVTATLAR